jgi:hypothetical protein
MPEDSPEVTTYPINSITLKDAEGSFEFSPTLDGDALDKMSDSEIFRVYAFCKRNTELRVTLYHEMVKRAEARGIARVKYFADHGFNADTEYRFAKKQEELRLEEAELAHAALNPQPVPELGIGEAGDEGTTTREELVLDTTTTNPPEPAPKKKCKKCAQLQGWLDARKKEVADLEQTRLAQKDEIKRLRAELLSFQEAGEKARKAAKKQPAVNSTPTNGGSMIGVKSEPVDGFYWEFVKEGMYAIRDEKNPHLDVLTKLKSVQDADLYISERVKERRAAA